MLLIIIYKMLGLSWNNITSSARNNMFARWWKPIQWSVYTWIDSHLEKNPDFQHPKQPDLVPTPVDPHTPWPAPRSTKKVDAKA